MGIKEAQVKTNVGNIGCRNDGSVYMEINFKYKDEPAQITLLMSNVKATEVYKTIKKAAGQGRAWLETGVPPI